MKRLLIILLTISGLYSYGQITEDYIIENYYNLTTKTLDLSSFSIKKNNQSSKIIDQIIKDSTNSFCQYQPSDFSTLKDFQNYYTELYSNFHFIDLDNDSDLDIVYQGKSCPGNESESVLIYSNTCGNYIKTLDSHGEFVYLRKNKEIILYEYPCCAMIENVLIKFAIKKDSLYEEFSLLFFNSEVLHFRPIGYDDYINIMPKTLKKTYNMIISSNAKINYTPQDSILHPSFIKDNLISETEKEIKSTVYSSYLDKNGNTWIYCKIPSVGIYKTDKILYLLAWINKKYSR